MLSRAAERCSPRRCSHVRCQRSGRARPPALAGSEAAMSAFGRVLEAERAGLKRTDTDVYGVLVECAGSASRSVRLKTRSASLSATS
ncbi:hypothetical protein M446_6726 [Methylobacterium sp. 4-46]|nr:hypothetical protein M446_6726 [Methylobacterium sp. 4-46]